MTEVSALERRYRRLLAAYPPPHRQVHGEEMVGVLLASAGPRQRWPRLADAADLIAGATRIRFRALRGRAGDPAWRDALALVSVIAPMLLLADGLATADLVGVAIRSATGSPENPFWLAYPWNWSITFGPAIVMVFALAGWRRSVAVTALATTVGATVPLILSSASYLASPGMALRVYLGLLTAAGALLSPGPRRGTEILRWQGVAVIGLAALGLAELTKGPEFDIPIMQGFTPLAVIAAALVLATAVCLISRAGRRALVLLVIPGVPYASYLIGSMYAGPGWWPGALSATEVLLPVLLAMFVIIMAVLRARNGAAHSAAPPGAASAEGVPPEDQHPDG
jgi:hypothetical protein